MTKEATMISVINWKGGVGKTTLTHHLATALQSLPLDELKEQTGKHHFPKVLLVDADAQCNLSISCVRDTKFEKMLNDDQKHFGIKALFETFLTDEVSDVNLHDYIVKKTVRSQDNRVYKNIDLIPSHPDLIYTDMDIAVYSKPNFRDNLMSSDIYKFQILRNFLTQVKDDYDYIFIDCPPNLNFITQNALYVSDYYVIPTIPDKLSSYGILSIKNKVDELNQTFQSADSGYTETKLLGIIPNKIHEYGERPKSTQANTLNTLKNTFPGHMFDHYLTYGDGITRASEQGYPVFAYENNHQNSRKQSKLLRDILREMLVKMDGVSLS